MKKIVLISFISIGCFADTFYIKSNDKNVTLKVINDENRTSKKVLFQNEQLVLNKYKEICLDKYYETLEVGIKENEDEILNANYNCYIHKKMVEDSFLTKVILKFTIINNIITPTLGNKKLVSLAGRGDSIKISKKEYPNLELDFSELENKEDVKIYINSEEENFKTFQFNHLKVGDELIITVGEGNKNSYEQEFEIIK